MLVEEEEEEGDITPRFWVVGKVDDGAAG